MLSTIEIQHYGDTHEAVLIVHEVDGLREKKKLLLGCSSAQFSVATVQRGSGLSAV